MIRIGVNGARTHFSALLERVGQGERFMITRRGTPVALLTTPPSGRPREVALTAERLRALRRDHRLDRDATRALIDLGRC